MIFALTDGFIGREEFYFLDQCNTISLGEWEKDIVGQARTKALEQSLGEMVW